MIDRIALAFLAVVAVGCIVSIWRERRADDRDTEEKRFRHYQGHL